ncbi:MAG: type II toxin-antitoxin system VapC family toxin [Myxococcales bacterium]
MLDASAVLELLLGTDAGAVIAARLAEGREALHAPHLLDVEVAHVLRRLHAAGEFEEVRGREALQDLLDLDIERWPHADLLPRAWELRAVVTAYDASGVSTSLPGVDVGMGCYAARATMAS